MRVLLLLVLSLGSFTALAADKPADSADWPATLPGEKNGTVTLHTPRLLDIPDSVTTAAAKTGAAPFVVAKSAPTIDLAMHRQLGPDAKQRRLWSSWGDICLARDGLVYSGIGDHGNDVGGDARCFLYRWDDRRRVLEQIVDMNRVVPPKPGQPSWSKVHAKIDEGPDGGIYFSCTLNDGNRASQPTYGWHERLPGGQIYRYDPQTGETAVFANLPPKRCTATSLVDLERGLWWCNLEAGGNALWALDLRTKAVVFQGADGSVGFNRNFALGRDGSIYFNGPEGLEKYDAATRRVTKTRTTFPGSPGMRASSAETQAGDIYGVTHATNQLFRYSTKRDELELLGPSWLTGEYTTIVLLSPDERFLYYLPGAHGGAFKTGTPVVQYEIASGRRKVLAFLAPACSEAFDYVPAGTYGAKLSQDGATLFVNFNGHTGDKTRPAHIKPIGFGQCAFAAVRIPASER